MLNLKRLHLNSPLKEFDEGNPVLKVQKFFNKVTQNIQNKFKKMITKTSTFFEINSISANKSYGEQRVIYAQESVK